MVAVLLIVFALGAASLAFGSLVGGAIRYGAAWDGLEAEWRGGNFTSTVHVAIREPRLPFGGTVTALPTVKAVRAVPPADGLRAAA